MGFNSSSIAQTPTPDSRLAITMSAPLAGASHKVCPSSLAWLNYGELSTRHGTRLNSLLENEGVRDALLNYLPKIFKAQLFHLGLEGAMHTYHLLVDHSAPSTRA